MGEANLITRQMVLAKVGELKGMLAKLQEQIVAEAGDDFQKREPKTDDLSSAEADYARAADAVREHNKAGTQEGAEGLAATQQLLKLASLRERARKEAGEVIR